MRAASKRGCITIIAGMELTCEDYLQRGSHAKQLIMGDDSRYSYCEGKGIFISINLLGVLLQYFER